MHTLRQLQFDIRKYVSVALAISVCVAFVVVALQFGDVLTGTTRNQIAANYKGSDIIVNSGTGAIDDTMVAQVEGIPGVGAVERRPILPTVLRNGSRVSYTVLAPLPSATSMLQELSIVEGRLPEGPGEIVLFPDAAESLNVDVGETIAISVYGETGLQIVGILKGSTALSEFSSPEGYAWPPDTRSWEASFTTVRLLVVTEPDADANQVANAINRLESGDLTAVTIDQHIDTVVDEVTGEVDMLSLGILGFAGIALFVCALVITNTFSVLIAQRTRTLALTRCIGATRRQVHRSVLTEAFWIGLGSSLLGVVIGTSSLQLLVRLAARQWPNAGIDTNVELVAWHLLVPMLLGTVVTLLTSLSPARAATRVSPLAALLPNTDTEADQRISPIRAILALLVFGFGIAVMFGGTLFASEDSVALGLAVSMFGGMISVIGMLMGATAFVPLVLRIAGRIAGRIGGIPAWIAASNSRRNPRRATAAVSAVFVAVALISTMSVGAENLKSTIENVVESREPVDIMISTEDFFSPGADADALPTGLIEQVREHEDVAFVAPVLSTWLVLNGIDVQVIAFEPEIAEAITRTDTFDGVSAGTVVMQESVANDFGVSAGDSIALHGENGATGTFEIAFGGTDSQLFMTTADAEALVSTTSPNELWLKLNNDVNVVDAVGDIQDSIESYGELYVTGGAETKARNFEVLDRLLMIVTGLLAVAALIALTGVSNTLSLSVIDRTRESAMLRAIGLTSSQLRLALTLEGMLLACVGALLGIAAGLLYGTAGALALFGGSWNVHFSVPIERLLLILAVALLAGILASVIPANRATRVSPVAALAVE